MVVGAGAMSSRRPSRSRRKTPAARCRARGVGPASTAELVPAPRRRRCRRRRSGPRSPALVQGRERIGDASSSRRDADDALHRREPVVGWPIEEEGPAVDIVVAGVGVGAIVPAEPGLAGEDIPRGIGVLEGRPAQNLGRQERQLGAGQFADDGLAAELLPPRFGLPVPHDEIAVAQVAGGAEVVDRAAGSRRRSKAMAV